MDLFRNIFLKTLRDVRWAALWVGTGLGVVLLVTAATYPQFIHGTAAEREQQSIEMTQLLQSFSFLLGEIVPIGTVEASSLRGLWASCLFCSACGPSSSAQALRGEEEQGALEVLLSTPHSRLSIIIQKLAALMLGIAVAVLIISVFLAVGIATAGGGILGRCAGNRAERRDCGCPLGWGRNAGRAVYRYAALVVDSGWRRNVHHIHTQQSLRGSEKP